MWCDSTAAAAAVNHDVGPIPGKAILYAEARIISEKIKQIEKSLKHCFRTKINLREKIIVISQSQTS